MKGMLFNTEDVKAILDNRKTVTRRLIKAAMPDWSFVELETDPYQTRIRKDGEMYPHKVNGLYAVFEDGSDDFPMIKAPYQPGDVLYVKETFDNPEYLRQIFYKADGDLRPKGWQGNWKPSLHMPKEAARIFLRVTDVRVERLKDIEDCWRFDEEGIILYHGMISEAWRDFADLWNSAIKKSDLDKYGWEANPWVWVIKFERISVLFVGEDYQKASVKNV